MDKLGSFTSRCVFQILNHFFKSFLKLSHLLHVFPEVLQIYNAATVPLMQIQMQGHLLHVIFLLIAGKYP